MICLFCLAICIQCYSAAINFGLVTLNRLSLSLPLSFSSSSHFLSFSKPKFRVGDPQSPVSISSSFILFFALLPFFLKTKISGWRPSIAFLYLFLFHSLLHLTFFLSQNQNQFQTRNTMSNTCWPGLLWRGSEEPQVGRWVFYISLLLLFFFLILKAVVFLVHEAWLSIREIERRLLVVRWLEVR